MPPWKDESEKLLSPNHRRLGWGLEFSSARPFTWGLWGRKQMAPPHLWTTSPGAESALSPAGTTSHREKAISASWALTAVPLPFPTALVIASGVTFHPGLTLSEP